MINLGEIVRYIAGTIILAALALMLMSLPSCGCLPRETQVRDSIVIQHHTDSVCVYEHDSVIVRLNGDTVYVEKWRDRWRERIVLRADTIFKDKQTEKTVEIKVVPAYYKWCSRIVWLLIIIIAARVGWWVVKKYYWHI